jgi:TATA-box binding protein (TBP) (component of TFIID and TFIIIB)|eukprot:Stramenopile-MAST_4_protein_4377
MSMLDEDAGGIKRSLKDGVAVKPASGVPPVKVMSRMYQAKLAHTFILGTVIKAKLGVFLRKENKSNGETVGIMKLRKPAVTALLESDATLTILKCGSKSNAEQVVKIVQSVIQETGQTTIPSPKIELKSVSGTVEYHLHVKLESLELDDEHWKHVRYAPEIKPFLVYRYPNDRRSTLLVFASGKMIIKNASSENELQEIVNEMHVHLSKHSR